MKRSAMLLAAGLATACAAGEPAELSESAQSRLADALAGRTAGPAVECINQTRPHSTRTIGDGAILYSGPGDTIWVNRPPGGCPGLAMGRALRTQTPGTQLCRGDIVVVFDPVSGVEFGGCGLGEFVPYRRAG